MWKSRSTHNTTFTREANPDIPYELRDKNPIGWQRWKHILLTVLSIFWREFWLKPRYFVLNPTENGKVFKTLFPFRYEIVLPVMIAH